MELVASDFEVMIYHGPTRGNDRLDYGGPKTRRITRKLNRDNAIFNANERNRRVVVLTTYQTLTNRHGPGAQAKWRRAKGVKAQDVHRDFHLLDEEFPDSLSGCFGRVFADEVQNVRNESSYASTTMEWLRPRYHVLITATPMITGSTDILSYLPFVKPRLSALNKLNALGPREDPYKLDPADPRHCFCALPQVARGYIILNKDPYDQAVRIAKMLPGIMTRRTYASTMPYWGDEVIGRSVPPVHPVTIGSRFTVEELEIYNGVYDSATQKLVKVDANGNEIINTDAYRKLVLSTSWLKFRHLYKWVTAEGARRLYKTKSDSIIFEMLREYAKRDQNFRCPAQNDTEGLLNACCEGSPKMRTLLSCLADEVIAGGERLIIWTLFPGQQLFVYGVCKLLRLSTAVISSHLKQEARDSAIADFTNPERTCQVLVVSFITNNAGLNLQHTCHRQHFFETAPSEPIKEQAVGRCRRVGQRKVVWVHQHQVSNSYNTHQLTSNLLKVLPSMIAHLSDDAVMESEGTLQEKGRWVVVRNGEHRDLFPAGHPDIGDREATEATLPEILNIILRVTSFGQSVQVP